MTQAFAKPGGFEMSRAIWVHPAMCRAAFLAASSKPHRTPMSRDAMLSGLVHGVIPHQLDGPSPIGAGTALTMRVKSAL